MGLEAGCTARTASRTTIYLIHLQVLIAIRLELVVFSVLVSGFKSQETGVQRKGQNVGRCNVMYFVRYAVGVVEMLNATSRHASRNVHRVRRALNICNSLRSSHLSKVLQYRGTSPCVLLISLEYLLISLNFESSLRVACGALRWPHR